ncbi:MAG: M12 family metallo-peptidase, partial [Thermoanaerobaculia bacterium]
LWVLAGGTGTGIVAPGLISRRAEPDLELADRIEGFRCETDRLPLRESPSEPALAQPQSVIIEQGAGPTYAARVAIETDYEYFTHFGGAPAAIDYAADLIGYSSTIYEAEVDTSLQISFIGLWSSPSDPWTENDCEDMSYELQYYWQVEPNRANEERTLVHMLSGKSPGCGIAWIGVLCDKTYGFGVSSGLTFGFNINNPGIGWDIMVVSHEIGHNFNSLHSHCYGNIGGNGWAPVDRCSNAECSNAWYDCNCETPTLPLSIEGEEGPGTLMSYCHLYRNQMTDIALTFGTDHPYGFQPKRVPDRMKTHVASRAASNVGCFNPLLTITKHGTGTGTVTSDDGGIDCGIECTEPYPPGAVVVALTAAEDANSTFNGWSGDPDCSDGVVTMSSSKTCTATFNLVPRLLTIAKAEGGTVVSSPVGIDCGIDCQESYLHGSAVSLAAVPDIGWMVGGWSGDADCSDGHLTMNDDRTCSMTFEICSPSQLDVPDQNVSTPVPEPFAACNIVTAAAFRVLEGGEVTFRAGNTIILKDGFEVHSGASFRAIIGPPSS